MDMIMDGHLVKVLTLLEVVMLRCRLPCAVHAAPWRS